MVLTVFGESKQVFNVMVMGVRVIDVVYVVVTMKIMIIVSDGMAIPLVVMGNAQQPTAVLIVGRVKMIAQTVIVNVMVGGTPMPIAAMMTVMQTCVHHSRVWQTMNVIVLVQDQDVAIMYVWLVTGYYVNKNRKK
tara:strand:- start:721 stop:1125 length:405 start_codon:yes stop_codon:yes gene_type:complete